MEEGQAGFVFRSTSVCAAKAAILTCKQTLGDVW